MVDAFTVDAFNMNDGEFARGIVHQGEQSRIQRLHSIPEVITLRTIPIRSKRVGKAIGALITHGSLLDDEHHISVVMLDKRNLEFMDEDTLIDLAKDNDVDLMALKEAVAMFQFALNCGHIHDEDYFALYWCKDWSKDIIPSPALLTIAKKCFRGLNLEGRGFKVDREHNAIEVHLTIFTTAKIISLYATFDMEIRNYCEKHGMPYQRWNFWWVSDL